MKKFLTIIFVLFTTSAFAQPVRSLQGNDLASADQLQVQAQTEKPSSFYWNQSATLQEAIDLEYWLYIEGQPNADAIQLKPTTCIDKKLPDGIECNAPIPAIKPGNYIATLTAYDGVFESIHSVPVSFSIKVTIVAPTNFRVVPSQ